MELRVRAVEEENQALRRELSRLPRSPSVQLHSAGHHGNQSRAHSEEGTGDNEGQKAAAVRNGSDCVQQPAVDKCEVSFTGHGSEPNMGQNLPEVEVDPLTFFFGGGGVKQGCALWKHEN